MFGKIQDKLSSLTIFLFIPVLVILGGRPILPKSEKPDLKNERTHVARPAPLLPKTVGMWTGPDSPQIVTDKNIFDYMDGAGELYLGYRFDHLEVYEYKARTQQDILVELYFMEGPADAFGLLSLDWGGESMVMDPPSQNEVSSRKNEFDSSGWPQALYGEGLLRLRSDDIYARVMATRETPESRQAVLSLGRSIAKGRAEGAPPSLLKEIHESILPDWEILEERLAYFRSHLVLNSLYYLSHENILDLGTDCEAATVLYQRQDSSGGRINIRFLLVKYPEWERAKNALIHFQRAYLPEHPLPQFSGSREDITNIFSVEDGWMAYRLQDKFLYFIFQCPDRGTAGALVEQIE
jgi:hypothetical protein